MALEAAELLAAAAYLRLRGVAGGAAPPPSPPRADAAALSPALSRLATLELAAELATLASMDVSVAGAASAAELAAALPAPGAAPREMNYVIAASFGIEALVVGTVLSTRPTWLSATHGHGLPAVGAALAAGEAAGTVALFAMAPAAAQARVRRLLPRPSACSPRSARSPPARCSSRSPGAAVALVVGALLANDVAASLLAEAQGALTPAAHYARVNAAGNIARRAGNAATALLGPSSASRPACRSAPPARSCSPGRRCSRPSSRRAVGGVRRDSRRRGKSARSPRACASASRGARS
jgi:hypothetical protein